MKKIVLGFLILLSLHAFSQSIHNIDFETGGTGTDWTWVMDSNDDNPPLEFIANPVSGGINTSATVAKFIARQNGQPWALTYTDDDGEFTFDGTNSTVTIMVYKPTISPVAVKFEGASPAVEIQVSNTLTDQWEELTFDFSGSNGNTYSRLVIIPDFTFDPRPQDNILYFDNIEVPDGVLVPPPPEPTTAAPDPTQDPADVISMFSDVYTDVPVDTWLTVWSDGDLEEVLIDGNPTKKYTNVNFVGVETVGPNLIDASDMTHFHLDLWTPDANNFNIKLVDFGADGAYGGGDDSEHEIVFTAPATETWISYDIPLTDFTNLLSTEHLAQLIMVKAPLGTLYIDNVFYYTATTSSYPTHIINFESPFGIGAEWTWVMDQNDDNPPLEIIANPVSGGINTSNTVAKFTARQNGQPWALTYTDDDGEFTFDAQNSTVTIMVYKSTISPVAIKFEGASPEVEIQVSNTLTDEWEELTYDFSGSIGNTYSRLVVIPDFTFDPRPADNIIYFDNIEVPDGVLVPPPPEPMTAAPDPTQDPADVISMFSDVYTDVPVDTWLTVWSDGDLEEVLIDGNPTKKYTNVNFVGVETVGPNLIDASNMTHFHMDMWTPDANNFNIKLVDFGADGAYGGGDDSEHEIVFTAPATETWISYDIPLTDFTNLLSTEHLAQLIMVKAPLGTMYIDNVFYYITQGSEYPTHVIDFEASEIGEDWTWVMDSNDDNPPLEFIANPVSGGINTSATVAKFTARQNGQPWALTYTDDDGEFIFDTENSTVTIMVYKSTISPVAIKFEGASPAVEIQVSNTLTDEWEELTYDFSGSIGNTYSRLVIIPDFTFDPRPADNIIYFDNIEVPDGVLVPPPPEPMTAAPDPTQDPANVISMFSDVYTDVPVDTWLTVWSDADLEEVLIDGNPTKKYTNVNFLGVETVGDNLIDASEMTHFHLDMWSPDANNFHIKLVDFGADGAYGGGDDSEHELIFENPATEQWISYDIPLTDFTGLTSTEHMAQLIMVKAPLGIIYIDNVFYYTEVPLYSLDGYLTYFNGTPMDNVTLDIGGVIAQTDATGYYGPVNIQEGTYTIVPTHAEAWTNFDPIDLLIYKSWLATGNPPLSTLQKMAGDVDANGLYQPVDALYMSVKYAQGFWPGNSAETPEFIYYDTQVTVTGNTTHDFQCIMKGDVNGSNPSD